MSRIQQMLEYIIEKDQYLKPFQWQLQCRLEKVMRMETLLTGEEMSLSDFALGHEYFGLHVEDGRWVFRERAPNAQFIHLIGEMTGWKEDSTFQLKKISHTGIWEIKLPLNALKHGDLYRLKIRWHGGEGDRIPSFARRVVQDPSNFIFNAQVWLPDRPYVFRAEEPLLAPLNPLIYEVHIGMSQEEPKVGTYKEFTQKILPRIAASGYNTLQLMGIQEHPYYGSFGYHVSSLFAPSSRFGTPEDLKALIDSAHEQGLFVLMDLIHSHGVSNTTEGLSLFDGTGYLYFHDGPRGHHVAWDSKCYDYGKIDVLHLLLSNIRFWIETFHVDGFRFDGITSMLYSHHGLNIAFSSYENYFDESVDEDALIYLSLANKLVHSLKSSAITIAEDISGMPTLAMPSEKGGIGFDYRFAMGIPDYWIKLTKDVRDEDWHMGQLWYELLNRRSDEKTISYAESHDQALVGDKTLMFRMADDRMYWHMSKDDSDYIIDRAMALHKMIRIITLATAGSGYLNFFGNEFGHPEWVDFPREGNQWSYHYARRQWSLVDDKNLKYQCLDRFDKDMLKLSVLSKLLSEQYIEKLWEHNEDKVLAFKRSHLFLVFNFHPSSSYNHYRIAVPKGLYHLIMDSDDSRYGGHGRLDPQQVIQTYHAGNSMGYSDHVNLYLPARTVSVWYHLDVEKKNSNKDLSTLKQCMRT